MPQAPSAVLDANVLFPFQLRNLLLHLAAEGQFQPLWSDEIVAEFLRALRRDAGLTEAQCAHLSSQMRAYFPHARREGHDDVAKGIPLPDEGDRHVIALAMFHEAEFIVTRNLRHFPTAVLLPLGIEPVDPQTFVEILFAVSPAAVIRAAELHRCSLRKHPLPPDAYLESLRSRAELPRIADLLATAGFLGDAARIEPEP
jgi:predicted nucleic acid-binding protein